MSSDSSTPGATCHVEDLKNSSKGVLGISGSDASLAKKEGSQMTWPSNRLASGASGLVHT